MATKVASHQKKVSTSCSFSCVISQKNSEMLWDESNNNNSIVFLLSKQANSKTTDPDDVSDNLQLPISSEEKYDACISTDLDKEEAVTSTPPCTPQQEGSGTSSDEGEYTDVYEADEEYDGPPYASQPMITGKHGASYTPPGWKRKRVKRAKIYLYEDTTPRKHTSEKSESDDSSDLC